LGHAAGFCHKFGMLYIFPILGTANPLQNEPGQQTNGSQVKSATPQPEATTSKPGLKPTAAEFKPQSCIPYVYSSPE
jgi:hypothetical protein